MKKRIFIVFIFIFIFIFSFSYTTNALVSGDVDGDGNVGSSDYILVRKHLLDQGKLTGDRYTRADANNDGNITSADYIEIRKMIINGKAVTPTIVPTKSATQNPTATATSKPTATATSKPTVTATIKPNATSKPTATQKPTATATSKPTATQKPTATATSKPTSTATASNTFTIKFNANGGSVDTTKKTVKKGESYGSLPTPTKTGYKFVGWFTSKEANFNSTYYSNTYGDLKNAFGYNYTQLLFHWFNFGFNEGRRCNPLYVNSSTIFDKNKDITLYAGWVVDYSISSSWNKYEISYSSSEAVKGTIVYPSTKEASASETFFLEPATNGKFTSYINYWVDGNSATGISSIKYENLNGEEVNIVNDIKLVNDSSANDLLNKHKYNTKNDYNSKTVFIGNDYITLGISLEWGGTVTYLSGNQNTFSGGIVNKNVINTADDGREIQDSFYGNSSYKNEPFAEIGSYNPVQGGYTSKGVSYGSKIVDIKIDDNSDTITVISRPLLWSLTNGQYISDHSNEYSGAVSESYIYQTYKLVNNRVELSHSFIDFSDNFSSFYNCDGPFCPHAEAPVLYATANLNILKYKDVLTGDNVVFNKNGEFDDKNNKIKVARSRYAGLYTSGDQGIGMYIKNFESYPGYNNYGSVVLFHSNFRFIGSSSSSSKSGDTIILHLLNHIRYAKAKQIELPSVVFVLGSYSDLENLINIYK